MVRPLLQQGSISLPGLFYHRAKDSEISSVRMLLQNKDLASGQLTFDALHTQYETLEMVQQANGIYVAQVKANQAQLLEDVEDHITLAHPFAQSETWNRGHGRLEYRQVCCYDVAPICFEKR